MYARLAASVGINAVVINNVNVKGNATKLIDDTYGEELRQMKAIFDNYGIDLYLSLNFAGSYGLGGLDSADPCSEEVADWWEREDERNVHQTSGIRWFPGESRF